MRGHPRFQAEFFIWQNVDELKAFTKVFHTRVARAFDGLAKEAEELAQSEFDRMGSLPGNGDMGAAAEQATNLAAAFFTDTDDVGQGVFNLMTAGLYHLFEQQADRLRTVLPLPSSPLKSGSAKGKLEEVLALQKVDLSCVKNWSQLNELRLVANTIKHGDGDSAAELRKLRSELFDEQTEHPIWFVRPTPLRPLVGEGLRLSETVFVEYAAGLEVFWLDLADRLYPVICRKHTR